MKNEIISSTITTETEKSFELPDSCCAATCGSCGWYYAGECGKYGGYVDADKWACSSYA